MENISAQELKKLFNQGVPLILIDVRTPAEYEQLHIKGAKNLPLGSLNRQSLEKIAPPGTNLYFICKSGGRSTQASQKAQSIGLWKIINVSGGTDAAKEAGLEIMEGSRKIMSIERQVRIIAGFLVLVGIVLGFAVSSTFFFLSGLVGAGLVFAGLTDFCGMALILEKCPWNQSKLEQGTSK